MPIRPIPGSDWRYLLICHDADGVERSDDPDGRLSEVARTFVADAAAPVTDVIVMSHGWLGDVPAAERQYDNWTQIAYRCAADIARAGTTRPGFRPLVVGLHWPSQPWGDEDIGATSFGGVGAPPSELDAYANVLGDTPSLRAALAEVLTAATADPEPTQLPPNVVAAYRTIEAAAGLRANGPNAAPGADRESFDPQETYRIAGEIETDAPSFGSVGLGRILAPLRMLSFWKMKDRARQFGESGAHQLALSLQAATAGRDVRFHAMGHSFGCIVVSAMMAGPRGSAGLLRPFQSAFLAQGAVSLWAYCGNIPSAPGSPGYFNSLIAQRRVQGPIVTTQSSFDAAVGKAYPLGAGVARQVAFDVPGAAPQLPTYGGIGTFGIQGSGMQVVAQDMRPLTAAYDFHGGTIYNLKADAFVKGHSDIVKPEVAHAMWSAILA